LNRDADRYFFLPRRLVFFFVVFFAADFLAVFFFAAIRFPPLGARFRREQRRGW
jgi:hypothetical protein